ncbi:Antimicrobial protein MiAMP1 [Macleaya cordata]|uniref:Antimicrobial protein MiAMP1 n=1 Tax=Macleaya cordata TaxID=56857 RepID=A0A200RB16_MACCD|nr:Antimicrobial protein MiAMP1 [Macleaya cordata]
MASPKSSSVLAISSMVLVMVPMMLMVFGPDPVSGSHLTIWSGPGCNNRAVRYSNCGCSSIAENGGYEFAYTGQTAAVYNQPSCMGVAHTRFNSNARSCDPVGWKSIHIQC